MAHILKGFTVAHLNVRSIRNKMDELAVLVSEPRPKVLTISETWLNEFVDSAILALVGYSLYREDRSYSKSGVSSSQRGGGLATYVLSDLIVDSSRFAGRNTCNKDIETQILYVKSPGDKGTVIANIYRPRSFGPILIHLLRNRLLHMLLNWLMNLIIPSQLKRHLSI